MFLIETEEKYPADYDETDEQGGRENRERTQPKLASHIQNLDDYDTIFLGFPIWSVFRAMDQPDLFHDAVDSAFTGNADTLRLF